MIYIVRMLIMTFIEIFCLLIFFDTFLKLREKCRGWRYVILFLLGWGVGIGNAYVGIIYIRLVVAIVSFVVISHVGFEGKIRWKILFSILYYGIILMADGIVQLFVITNRKIIISSTNVKYTVLLIIAKLLLLIIVLTIKLVFRRKRQYNPISVHKWILYMIFPIMTIVIMLVFLTFEENMAMAIGTMILLCLNVIFVTMMNIILDRENKITEIKLMEENAERQLGVYSVLEQAYREQRKSTHEFRHHMDCVFGLLKDNEFDSAREYVEKINGGFIEDMNSLDTGHPIVNIVLNQKIKYASDRGINLVPVFNNLKQIKLDKEDIVVILSNLLDNAIEACERLRKEKKEIKLYIEDDEEYTTLIVKNPLEKERDIKNGKFITAKDDKLNHGIGMSNVKNIVEKYAGECVISTKDNIFSYTIHIEY